MTMLSVFGFSYGLYPVSIVVSVLQSPRDVSCIHPVGLLDLLTRTWYVGMSEYLTQLARQKTDIYMHPRPVNASIMWCEDLRGTFGGGAKAGQVDSNTNH
ncbi:hypothetical protein PAXRUDRAFT_290776 [Paxillus rubicundulus Ve08.2h10]|uniref:Uncharacterized protein n=1 Tax=Paxillus rubicundulus Ve08.2h10 TaxID=930991 RepID=A0A0D0DST2_9AGAM|nr:hypothetical protein PAXRUDRAFT_290776 [Paxillus rubicundulus Ve08.2h10]